MGYDLYSSAVAAPSEAEYKRLLDEVTEATKGMPPQFVVQAGYDAMASTGHYFRFADVAWRKLLQLAEQYGWAPAREREAYFRQDGSEMSAWDAARLADACRTILDTLSDVEPRQPAVGELKQFMGVKKDELPTGGFIIGPRSDLSPEAFYSDPVMKEKIRRFIVFARRGAFRIE